MTDEQSWRVIGPLYRRLIVSDEDGQPRFHWPDRRDKRGMDSRTSKVNARLILHRTAVALIETDHAAGLERMSKLDDGPARTWAVETDLGQRRDDELSAELAARRAKALQLLAEARNAQVLVVEIEPQGALVTGTGAGGIRDVGIELHGTHGWPIIPASGLKGVAAAYAQDTIDPPKVEQIFGSPRPDSGQVAKPGSVLFFDALPGRGGVTVAEHVLTPHVRDYHVGNASDGIRPAPGEYLNPVPIPFLAVDGGTFTAHLVGPAEDTGEAARLLSAAMDDIGVGAKTSAGYGYLTATSRTLGATTPELAR